MISEPITLIEILHNVFPSCIKTTGYLMLLRTLRWNLLLKTIIHFSIMLWRMGPILFSTLENERAHWGPRDRKRSLRFMSYISGWGEGESGKSGIESWQIWKLCAGALSAVREYARAFCCALPGVVAASTTRKSLFTEEHCVSFLTAVQEHNEASEST